MLSKEYRALLFCLALIRYTACLEVKFLNVLRDSKLTQFHQATLQALEYTKCLFECAQVDKCGSVNYELASQTCELNANVTGEEKKLHIKPAPGWKYAEKTLPHQVIFVRKRTINRLKIFQ